MSRKSYSASTGMVGETPEPAGPFFRANTYGMLGIYGGVADRLRLLDKADFTLTPSIGVDLGEAFLADTLPEPPLRRRIAKLAVDEAATLPLGELARWGERARPGMELSEPVARALRGRLVLQRATTPFATADGKRDERGC